MNKLIGHIVLFTCQEASAIFMFAVESGCAVGFKQRNGILCSKSFTLAALLRIY